MMLDLPLNPALNLDAFSVQSISPKPPLTNAIYLRDGKFDAMSRGDVRTSFQEYRKLPSDTRLTLFFHGGLVSKELGSQAAANEYEAYRRETFPLFFIWESGIGEVLREHLPLIFSETIFGRIKNHAETILSRRIGVVNKSIIEGLPTAPKFTIMGHLSEAAIETAEDLNLATADLDNFAVAISNDAAIHSEIARICSDLHTRSDPRVKVMGSARTELDSSVVASIRAAYGEFPQARSIPQSVVAAGLIQAALTLAKLAIPVLVNSMKRYAKLRDHGLTCTVVEEVLRTLYGANAGSSIWEEMKRETEAAFGGDPEVHGGTAVISELRDLAYERPGLKVTLVGHSTGGVYIGNFLHHVDRALGALAFDFDVILLAPANTFDFFSQNYRRRVRGLRLFGLTNDAEKADLLMSTEVATSDRVSFLGRVYPRSLLYLVSGICETFETPSTEAFNELDAADMPILGMARFFEETQAFKASEYLSVAYARSLLCNSPSFSRVLSPTPEEAPIGFRSGARKHGNFPGDPSIIESLRYCFVNGI